MNPPSNFTPLTTANWGSGQAQDLYGHSGFGQSTVSGNNPGQSFINQRFTPLLGSRIQSQLLFGNELEGDRQALTKNFLRLLRPENQQANAERLRTSSFNSALSQAPQQDLALQSMGIGKGARAGALQGAVNSSNSNANQYLAYLNSPEGMQALLNASLGVIGQGQTTNLQDFLAMNQAMEQNSQFRQANAGKGGLGGVFGNLVGTAIGGGWNPLGGVFGGGSGGSGGSENPWWLTGGYAS